MSNGITKGKSHFVDEVTITVISGKGGKGSVSFRREKFIPRGAPDGGDGGKGGDIIIKTDSQLRTLFDLRYRKLIDAENGGSGSKNNRHGKDGNDKYISVPVGSVIFDAENDTTIADLTEEGQSIVIAKGGRGGKGNAHFKSPTQRSPKFAQPGEEGEEKQVRIELKLLADVGLVGFPNVGKSSIVSLVSAAKPKISDYPFTTLTPNLGIVYIGEYSNFVICDIPGLIEGAHQGKGLGHQFLRHIERAKILACVVDVSSLSKEGGLHELKILEEELQKYKEYLKDKVKFVIGNKIDLGFNEDEKKALEIYCKEKDYQFFLTSAVTGQGLREVVKKMFNAIVKNDQE